MTRRTNAPAGVMGWVLLFAGLGGMAGCETVPSVPPTTKQAEGTAAPHEGRRALSGPVSQNEPTESQPTPAQPTSEVVGDEEAQPAPAPPAEPARRRMRVEAKASSSALGITGYGRGAGAIGGAPAGLAPRDALGELRAPSAPPNREEYDHHDPNPFIAVADQPLSTFSADVDTASYSNVRRFLSEGRLPPPSAVRVEEMLNYFRYDYPEPEPGKPFGIRTEVGPCPWAPSHRLVQIGLRTRDIPTEDLPPRNLVFLLDVSGSMQSPDKLPLLQRSMGLLVDQLRPQDRVAIVVYAGASGLVLPSTRGDDRSAILAAIEQLEAGGSTNGGAGIELAYQVAEQNRVDGINRVVLATDGDFNVGVSSRGELERLIEQKRKHGTYLTVLGFGTGNVRDGTMEMLADKGNGNYAYIDSLAEARKVLVREAGATLATVADDVKLQVELNPHAVARYRLIGYENRLLAAQDFNDDEKDAGEVGAGHMVTVLYEVVPAAAAGAEDGPKVDPLRYQSGRAPTAAADTNELMTLKVRYKDPGTPKSKLLTRPVTAGGNAAPSADMRFATAVAGFGLWLRKDPTWDSPGLAPLRKLATQAVGADPDGDRHELVALMKRAASLDDRSASR